MAINDIFVIADDGELMEYNGLDREVVIPEGVRQIAIHAFEKKDFIRSVTLPSTMVQISASAFSACKGLQRVVFNEGLRVIGAYAFEWCTALEEIILPSTLTELHIGAFLRCESLTSVYIPSCVMTVPDYCFEYCTSLAAAVIAYGPIAVDRDAFSHCDALKFVRIPSSVRVVHAKAFDGTDYDASAGPFGKYFEPSEEGAPRKIVEHNLPVTISGDRGSAAESFAAEYGFEFEEFDIAEQLPDDFFKVENGVLTDYYGCRERVVIPEGVTEIAPRLFEKNERITEVVMPRSLRRVGEGAFSECYYLNYITGGDSLEIIGDYAFAASGLLKLHLPPTLRIIGNDAFQRCLDLAEVTLPDGLTEIGQGAFFECRSLLQLSLPDSVEKIGKMAFGMCRKLQSVAFPAKIRELNDGMCSFCGITSIGFGAVEVVGVEAFANCHDLTGELVIPGSVRVVGKKAFCSCSGVKRIVISEGVEEIGEMAFLQCRRAEEIVLPRSLKSIGRNAFSTFTRGTKVVAPTGSWAEAELARIKQRRHEEAAARASQPKPVNPHDDE